MTGRGAFSSSTRAAVGLILLAALLAPSSRCEPEDYPVLTQENLQWKLLPGDLTRKVHPLAPPDDLRLRLGETAEGHQFLRILPPRLKDLSFGVKSTEREGAYIASAKRAIYWPRQHLLRLENDVIVSSTHCNLKGGTFDIHLHHDTVRLENPTEILLEEVSLPIVSQGVRFSGLGHPTAPEFEWDPLDEKAASRVQVIPEPTPDPSESVEPAAVPRPAPGSERAYRIRLTNSQEALFEGRTIGLAELEEEIRRIGREDPESTVVVEQTASADPERVRRIHRTLEESRIRKVQTTIVSDANAVRRLAPEVEPDNDRVDPALPGMSNRGGRLLWIYEPGRYNLNGKDYTEPALRQALRIYAREYSDLTLVIASPRPLPSQFISEFIRDVKAYGFSKIQVAADPSASR